MQQILKLGVLLGMLGLFSACGGSGGTPTSTSSSSVSSSSSASSSSSSISISPVVVAVTVGNGEAVVSWDQVPNADGYHLYYATETGVTPGNYASFEGGTWVQNVSSPYVLGGLTNGTRYFLVVTAFNAGSESSVSNQVDTIPGALLHAATRRLNDTGIDWCANTDTNNLDCPVEGFAGQDGDYGRDASARAGTLTKIGAGAAGFDFTKLDANGNTLAAGAASWSCVRDNHTRLIWEVKTADGGLRDGNNSYTWYNPDNTTNGGNTGVQDGGSCTGSACDTRAYVQAVNTQGLCGASDWRVPTRHELVSIAHIGRELPAIDQNYFPNTRSNWYWSSSPYAYSSDAAWLVYFGSGNTFYHLKSGDTRVRLVRSGQ